MEKAAIVKKVAAKSRQWVAHQLWSLVVRLPYLTVNNNMLRNTESLSSLAAIS